MGVSILKIAHFFGMHKLILFGLSTERLGAVGSLTLLETNVVATDTIPTGKTFTARYVLQAFERHDIAASPVSILKQNSKQHRKELSTIEC